MTRSALAYLPRPASPRPADARPQPRRRHLNPFSRYPAVRPKPRLGVKNWTPQNAPGLCPKTHANAPGITPVAEEAVVGCSVAAESEILTGGMSYTGRRLDVRAKFIDSPSAQVSTPGHAFASRRAAYELALDPAVERVTMNAGYKRLLRLDDSVSLPIVRPDAAAVYFDGRISRVEIMSRGDRFSEPLIRRNIRLDPQLRDLGYSPLRPSAYPPTGGR
jgi:hypothetical protein